MPRPSRLASVPWDRTLRSALVIALALPVAILLFGRAGVPLAVAGAVCSVNGDHSGPVGERIARFGGVLLGGSGGLLLGCLAPARGPGQVSCMAVAGLCAGLLGSARAADQLAGLKLMVLTAIGMGLGGSAPAGDAVAQYALGCLPMALLIGVAWLRAGRPAFRPRLPALPDRGRLGAALRLALCVGLAAVVAALLRPEHAFWLPLTAALAFRPADPSVVRRVADRVLGTVVGVLAAALLAPHLSGWALVVLALLIGALLPGATDLSYILHTALASVIVLVLAVPGPPSDGTVITARLTDTLIACAIALVVGQPFRGHRRTTA
ncbi:FUSC family protein [Kitasatospora sp. NPDC005856]|uniref:FUSC family protein n=1 Tax=Kitasatospora sp. NPDC005856 TaxID=3154566 RepID=UPI0033D880D6